MMVKKTIVAIAVVIVLYSCSLFEKTSKKNSSGQTTQTNAVAKTDTTKKVIKAYKDVITDKAITDEGLIKVQQVGSRYYFEIADSLFDKDLLVVNRISKAPAALMPTGKRMGYGGDQIGEHVVRFVKGPDQKIFIKEVSYLDMSYDSSASGMYRSVHNSSLQPIVASFDIKALSPDSAGVVVDITDYIIKGDNDLFSFDPSVKKRYKLGGMQADKSYIQSIVSFPLNTEIKTIKTYSDGEGLLTYELNSSIVLLPIEPMKPRSYDERVGYFSRGYRDFDYAQAAKASYMITRWRLEPKDEDIEKYKRGELVEPKKPIVYYIDPATPKKWVPYLIEGVNAWQKAFEKAGFKHAIYALEAPVDDPSWSLDDARHSAIVYKASFIENASGPQVSDPRSGEILESHINWYHNVQKILHDWYFVQAAPNDPRARTMQFDDELMGELIRYVCTHEVGHTLGLQHNFLASSTVPVDSLRSRSYVAQWGHTPSIMDYARFNYVAQPEDSIAVNDLIPRIGVYDEWAIEWGYKWIPGLKTREDEQVYMNGWIIQRLKKDERLFFAGEGSPDCSAQTEDLGDDPVNAAFYGIQNLQRVMTHLIEWTKTPGHDYKDLAEMQQIVFSQYYNYMDRLVNYIGGAHWIPKTVEQGGGVLSFVGKEKQKDIIQFLQEQLFDTPEWLYDKKIFSLVGGMGITIFPKLQNNHVFHLVNKPSLYSFLLWGSELSPSKEGTYSFNDLLTDLETGIWKELATHQKIELPRRSLQKLYTSHLINFIRRQKAGDYGILDACTIVEDHISQLYLKITNALPGYKDRESILHLKDVSSRLKAALDEQKKNYPESPTLIIKSNNTESIEIGINYSRTFQQEADHERYCWGFVCDHEFPN